MRLPVGARALIAAGIAALAVAGCDDDGQQALSGADSVRICHAAGGSGNYVSQSPNVNGILQGGSGHVNHAGDIIPPFEYIDNDGVTQQFPGQNWDDRGQAIHGNGCRVPAANTSAVPLETEAVVSTTAAAPPTNGTPTTAGIGGEGTDTTAEPSATTATPTTTGTGGVESETTAGLSATTVTPTTIGAGGQGTETTAEPPATTTEPPATTAAAAGGATTTTTIAGGQPSPTRPGRPTTTDGATPGGGTRPPGRPTTTVPPGEVEGGTASPTTIDAPTTTAAGGPAATSAPAPPGSAPGTIPRTGRDTAPLVLVAALFVALGMFAVVLVRRPNTDR